MSHYLLDIMIFTNKHKDVITKYVNTWSDFRDIRNIVLYYKNDNNITKYYYLKKGLPIFVNIGPSGCLKSCKFNFEEIKEISRPLKISEILKE